MFSTSPPSSSHGRKLHAIDTPSSIVYASVRREQRALHAGGAFQPVPHAIVDPLQLLVPRADFRLERDDPVDRPFCATVELRRAPARRGSRSAS